MSRILLVVGCLIAAFGWFRLLSPSEAASAFGRQIVNFHELTIALALIITGAAIAVAGVVKLAVESAGKVTASPAVAMKEDATPSLLATPPDREDLAKRAAELDAQLRAVSTRQSK